MYLANLQKKINFVTTTTRSNIDDDRYIIERMRYMKALLYTYRKSQIAHSSIIYAFDGPCYDIKKKL